MIILKLSAISSTNDYLKELLTQSKLENYTVVVTDYQVSGKGQGANKWHSEKGKNLLFSLLINFENLPVYKNAYLNFAVALGIHQVLAKYLRDVKIKWPNDIMAGDKKICGILIENTIAGSNIKNSIVGVGLNVNQLNFPEELKSATSFYSLLNKEFDKDVLLNEILDAIKTQIDFLQHDSFEELKTRYELVLYKKGIFETYMEMSTQNKFIGKIIGVSKTGLLRVILPNDTVREYANKEIIFII